MLDLCYFVNLSVLLQLHLAPDSLAWYQSNYALAMGSLMNAMVVWQNSLVLHNISKGPKHPIRAGYNPIDFLAEMEI